MVFGFGLAELLGVILGGVWGEKHGTLPFIFAGLLGMTGTGLLAGVAFGHLAILVFAVLLGGFSHGVAYAPQASFLSSLFPTLARTTGVSFAYQMGNALVAGTTPFVSTYVVKNWGWAAGGYYVAALLVLGMAAAILGSRRKTA
ncbi:MAG: MFS transporter [Bacillota bacterium]|nr:MFS transporter [Bacillota bacterium]